MDVWTFDDFDEYADAVRDADLEMFPRHLVHSRWTLRHLNVGGVHLQMGCQGSGDIVEGQARRDGYLVFLPLTNPDAQQGNGIVLDSQAVAIFEPGCDFILSSFCDHQWCSVFLPTGTLTDASFPSNNGSNRLRVTHPPSDLVRRFRRLVLRILMAAESLQAIETSPALGDTMRDLCGLAARIIGSHQSSAAVPVGRPRIPRDEIFARTLQLIASRGAAKLSVANLADYCGVTDRTLRSVFLQSLGLTPKQYLQYRKLNQVHHALRSADPQETSVTSVLLDHGEWEFGRFARRYRQAFGKLPSQTLRRSSI